jgi:hypothetical protein
MLRLRHWCESGWPDEFVKISPKTQPNPRSGPEIWSTSLIFNKTSQRNQSSNRRKFAQSGHPVDAQNCLFYSIVLPSQKVSFSWNVLKRKCLSSYESCFDGRRFVFLFWLNFAETLFSLICTHSFHIHFTFILHSFHIHFTFILHLFLCISKLSGKVSFR